jgi:hypothetical protein
VASTFATQETNLALNSLMLSINLTLCTPYQSLSTQTSCPCCSITEAFSRAGYFTVDCEAPNPRLYSFEGAICCWDVPPTYKVTRKPPPSTQLTNGAAAAAAAEVEMQTAGAAAGSPGWYTSEQQQQQQQQRRTGVGQGSPRGRRSPSPSRQQQQGAGSRLQQPLAAAAADGDSLTAALSTYGRPVRGTACVQSASFIVFEEWCGLDL